MGREPQFEQKNADKIQSHARELAYIVDHVGTEEFRFGHGELIYDENGDPIEDGPIYFDRPEWMTRPQGIIRWVGVKETRRITLTRESQTTNHPVKIYRIEPWAAKAATKIVESRDGPLPCDHAGLKNLRDGGFACSFEGCHEEFSRAEVDWTYEFQR
jgi:hypothetical protein